MELKRTLNSLGRSKRDQMLGGVCAGFAETTGTPAWLWRAGAVFFSVWAGTALLAYLVLWYFMPESDDVAIRR